MSIHSRQFASDAKKIAFDEKHRSTIKFNISRYDVAFGKGLSRYRDVGKAKDNAAAIKREMLNNWDNYLLEFEENISKRGVKVLWADDAAEATEFIKEILIENDARILVKSKSMTTEEIGLNETAKELN